MAKLYKIEGYLCDANGDLKDAEDFRSYLHMLINRGYYTLDAPIDFKITESKEFEWNDDNALDVEIKRREEYFNECLAIGWQFNTGELESNIKDLKEILEKFKNYIDANREELP